MSHANCKSFMYKIRLRRIELKPRIWQHVCEKIVVRVSYGNFFPLEKPICEVRGDIILLVFTLTPSKIKLESFKIKPTISEIVEY